MSAPIVKKFHGVECSIRAKGNVLVPYVGDSLVTPKVKTERGWLAQVSVGEYPYDSSVVLFWVIDDKPHIQRFLTEINPSGVLKCDRKFEEIKEQLLRPTVPTATVG